MEIELNLKQRIGWLSERINLTESDKSYIEFQMKELANETADKVKNNVDLGGVSESKLWYVEFKHKDNVHIMSTTSNTSSRTEIEQDLLLRGYEIVNVRRIYFR